VNRNRLLAGAAVLVFLMVLMTAAAILLRRAWNNRQSQTGEREPLPGLSYCSSSLVKPCILSFNLDPDGNMIINILTEGSSFPDFYLKVKNEERENVYRCENALGFPTNFSCRGETMPVGEVLQFLVVATRDDLPLAQGTFPIIGMALATPEIAMTPTFIPPFDRPPR
jgi:hypothetical protein